MITSVGDIYELTMSHGNKTRSEKYAVTSIKMQKYIELRKVKSGKTKIANLRFPLTITINHCCNALLVNK
jgi:hypothetical protein